VLAEVQDSIFPLAYLSKTLAILESDGDLLKKMNKAADAGLSFRQGESAGCAAKPN